MFVVKAILRAFDNNAFPCRGAFGGGGCLIGCSRICNFFGAACKKIRDILKNNWHVNIILGNLLYLFRPFTQRKIRIY